jgi:(1->4)-alpha-D-glucan 1-alpha-D-glucosylmutase
LLKLNRSRDGDYRPLDIEGPDARHIVAFARVAGNGEAAVIIVPRLAWTLGAGRIDGVLTHDWRDTVLRWPAELAGRWRAVLAPPVSVTGSDDGGATHAIAGSDALPLGPLLAHGPIAVLHRAAR